MFHAARELSGERRAALLSAADPAVRTEVKQLLSAGRATPEDGFNATRTMIGPGARLGPCASKPGSARAAWRSFPTIPLYPGRSAEAAEKVRIARKMVPEEPTLGASRP